MEVISEKYTVHQEETVNSADITNIDRSASQTTSLDMLEDNDVGYDFIVSGQDLELDQETNKRILQKIDTYILPWMCLVYFLQFLDKTTINYASVLNLQTDTHLVGSEYNYLGFIFYVGYFVAEYPTNLGLQRFPVAKYAGFNIICWGTALAFTAICRDFAGLMVVRTILGVFEACANPTMLILTSMYYKRHEQVVRVGYFYCMNGFAQIVGGLLGYGVGNIQNSTLAPWQWLFVITGCFSVIVGICFALIVPDSPVKARFLTRDERILAIKRVKENNTGIENKHWKAQQSKEAFSDIKCWLFALMAIFVAIPNGGLTNFNSILIKTFGFTSLQTQLLNIPSGIEEVIVIVGCVWFARRVNSRSAIIVFSMILTLIGQIMLLTIPRTLKNQAPLLLGLYLLQSYNVALVLEMSWLTSAIAGHTKKVTATAMFYIGFAIGNMIGPFLFPPADQPLYTHGSIVLICCYASITALALILRFMFIRENNRRDLLNGKVSAESTDYEKMAFMDLTDKQNANFRYAI